MTRLHRQRKRDTGLRPPRWWERNGNRYYVGAIVLAAAVIVGVYLLKNGE